MGNSATLQLQNCKSCSLSNYMRPPRMREYTKHIYLLTKIVSIQGILSSAFHLNEPNHKNDDSKRYKKDDHNGTI